METPVRNILDSPSYHDITNAKTGYLKETQSLVFILSSVHRTKQSEISVSCIVKHPQITKRKLNRHHRFISNPHLYFPSHPSWAVLGRTLPLSVPNQAASSSPEDTNSRQSEQKFGVLYVGNSISKLQIQVAT
jgi:hypothetical protein